MFSLSKIDVNSNSCPTCLYYIAYKISKQRRGFPWYHEFAYLSKKLPLFPASAGNSGIFSPSYFMQFQWLFSIIHISFKVPYYFFPSPVVAFIGKFLTQLSLSILSGLCLLTTRSEKTFVKKTEECWFRERFFFPSEWTFLFKIL